MLGCIASTALFLFVACVDEAGSAVQPSLSKLTTLGISRSEIQSEFEPDFEFEPLVRDDGQAAVIGRKFPEIARYTGEIVHLNLIGPEHELTRANVWFSIEIDPIDAIDIARFVRMVAPDVKDKEWIREQNWDWLPEPDWNRPDGVWKQISGDEGDVYIQASRSPLGYISITFTPRGQIESDDD